jgi:hypothetical protein
MENYSFRNHVLKHFQLLMEHNGFTVQEFPNKQSLSSQNDLVLWVSAKCKFQIFREHNKVFVEVAPLAMRTINDWYPVYVVIAFLSNSKPEDWAWLLGFPQNGFSYEVIDTQLSRWHELVGENIKQIADLFEENRYRELEHELNKFRTAFYSKLSQLLEH